jgi:hypothetical protein
MIVYSRPIPSLPWMHCVKKSRRYNPMTKNPGSRVQSPGYSNTPFDMQRLEFSRPRATTCLLQHVCRILRTTAICVQLSAIVRPRVSCSMSAGYFGPLPFVYNCQQFVCDPGLHWKPVQFSQTAELSRHLRIQPSFNIKGFPYI